MQTENAPSLLCQGRGNFMVSQSYIIHEMIRQTPNCRGERSLAPTGDPHIESFKSFRIAI